jgi:hypothetical protein
MNMHIDCRVRPRAQLSGLDINVAIGIAWFITSRERLPGRLPYRSLVECAMVTTTPRAHPESHSPDFPPPVNTGPNSGAEPHLDNYRYLVFSSPITSEPELLIRVR